MSYRKKSEESLRAGGTAEARYAGPGAGAFVHGVPMRCWRHSRDRWNSYRFRYATTGKGTTTRFVLAFDQPPAANRAAKEAGFDRQRRHAIMGMRIERLTD